MGGIEKSGGIKEAIRGMTSNPIDYMKKLGRTSVDSMMDRMINSRYDQSKGFASNMIERSVPAMTKPYESGADSLKNMLHNRY